MRMMQSNRSQILTALALTTLFVAMAGGVGGYYLGSLDSDGNDENMDHLEYQLNVSDQTSYFQATLIAMDLETKGLGSLDQTYEMVPQLKNYVWSKAKYLILKGMEEGDGQQGLLDARIFVDNFYTNQTQFFIDNENATLIYISAVANVSNEIIQRPALYGTIKVGTKCHTTTYAPSYYTGQILYNFGSYGTAGSCTLDGRSFAFTTSTSLVPTVEPVLTTIDMGMHQLDRTTMPSSGYLSDSQMASIRTHPADDNMEVYLVYDKSMFDRLYVEMDEQNEYMVQNLNLYANELMLSNVNASHLLIDPDIILAMTADINETQDYSVSVAELALLGYSVSGNYTDRYLLEYCPETGNCVTLEGILVADGDMTVTKGEEYNQSGYIITNDGIIRLDGSGNFTVQNIVNNYGTELNETSLIAYNAQSMDITALDAEIAGLRNLLQQVIDNEPIGGGSGGNVFGGIGDWIKDQFAKIGIDLSTLKDQVVVGVVVTLLIGFVLWGIKSLIPGG